MTLPAHSFLNNKEHRIRYWWPLILLVAIFSYFYSLDGLHIPKIGDENVYFQITHRTADAGKWLPLQSADGLENTKPPLLFWQGLVTTNWAKHWDPLRLRLPSIGFTLLVSVLIFLLANRLSRDRETAFLSVLSFLAFSSTFQHGRPYLTNMPETLFVFIPVFLYLYVDRKNEKTNWLLWITAGLSMGLAALYKSFVLIVPVGFSLLWMMYFHRQWNLAETIKKDIPALAVMAAVAMAIFALWPILDPSPQSIYRNFVLGENISKIGSANYFSGLFTGPYPVIRIWLGHLTNAGLMAIPLLVLAVQAIRQRQSLTKNEKLLWIYVLGFIVVYTIPGQRQENYLLPTVPALAILIGMGWQRFQKSSLLVFNLPLVLIVFILLFLMNGIDHRVLPNAYTAFNYFPIILALITIVMATASCRYSAYLFHLTIFLCFISLSSLLVPFEGDKGRYPLATQQALAGQTVYMPSNFRSRYERYRFLLPLDTTIIGYSPTDASSASKWLEEGKNVGVTWPFNKQSQPSFRIIGQRIDLRTRQSDEEVKKIIFERRLDLLFHKEVILRRESLSKKY